MALKSLNIEEFPNGIESSLKNEALPNNVPKVGDTILVRVLQSKLPLTLYSWEPVEVISRSTYILMFKLDKKSHISKYAALMKEQQKQGDNISASATQVKIDCIQEIIDSFPFKLNSNLIYVISNQNDSIGTINIHNHLNWKYIDCKECKSSRGKYIIPSSSHGYLCEECYSQSISSKLSSLHGQIKHYIDLISRLKEVIASNERARKIERTCLLYELEDSDNEVMILRKESKRMIGNLLKFQYLIEQVKRINGFNEQANDIVNCFNDIEIPDVSIQVKNEFVPTEITNTVDASTFDEDREYYGDSWGISDIDLEGIDEPIDA